MSEKAASETARPAKGSFRDLGVVMPKGGKIVATSMPAALRADRERSETRRRTLEDDKG